MKAEECIVVLYGYAWVIHAGATMVGHEQYIAYQCVQLLFERLTVLIVLSCEVSLYLTLRVELRAYGVQVVMHMANKRLFYILQILAKLSVKDIVVDVRL